MNRLSVSAVLAAGLLSTSPAAAQDAAAGISSPPESPPTTGLCDIRRANAVCVGLGESQRQATPLTAPAAGAAAHRRPARRPPANVRWEQSPMISQRMPGQHFGCTHSSTGRPGNQHLRRQVDITTGRILQSRAVCVPHPDAAPESPATPPIPIPPPERIWSSVPLPQPAWGLNPIVDGLTGLPTLLWDPTGGAPVTATVDLGGFTATATARPVLYQWRMWEPDDPENRNPQPVVTSRVPGTEAAPAATYTYETKGDYTVTYTVTWEGSYVFSGPGVNEVVDLGTTTTSSTRTYHVTEVRSVLRG